MKNETYPFFTIFFFCLAFAFGIVLGDRVSTENNARNDKIVLKRIECVIELKEKAKYDVKKSYKFCKRYNK